MKVERIEHMGSSIELAVRKGKRELRIDGRLTRWGRMHDGLYYLHEYAFDPHPDLVTVAKHYIEYLARVKGGKAQ